jgi:hypothetical protein
MKLFLIISYFSLIAAHEAPCAAGAPSAACEAEEEESALLQTSKSAVAVLSTAKQQIKVLDVGPPRTGTQSLAEALTRLGYNPCHSGEQILSNIVRPTLCNYTFGKGNTSWDDVEEMMKQEGWDAGMDEPWHLLYTTVMDKYPDSKFVLPIKKAEDWFDSYLHFWQSRQGLKTVNNVGYNLGKPWDECSNAHYFDCDFTELRRPLAESRDDCIAGYNRHVARVIETIPHDRLLLFNMSEGYAPLCEFLGKDVPTYPNGTAEPFPHADKFGTTFKERHESR